MWKILRNNFKEIYLFSVLIAMVEVVKLLLFLVNSFAGMAFTLLATVIGFGWYWYVIKIYRGEQKPLNAFKESFKSCGWVIILDILRTIITMLITFMVMILISLVFVIKEVSIPLIIFGGFVNCLINVKFVLSEFIYYDNRKASPINVIYDSILNTKKRYFKFFIPYILIIVPTLLNFTDSIILTIVRMVWIVVFAPVYILKMCEIYDKISIKNVEVNDSLTIVAKTLDEATDKY